MTNNSNPQDAEFAAMQAVYQALAALDEDAQGRVVTYVANRLGISVDGAAKTGRRAGPVENDEGPEEDAVAEAEAQFGSFAELYDAANPKTQPDKALLGGYWIQVCGGAADFDSFSINKELKNLGEGVINITSALDGLKALKPAFVLQLKKAGKSRQARKTYKVTVAGIKRVEAMLGG